MGLAPISTEGYESGAGLVSGSEVAGLPRPSLRVFESAHSECASSSKTAPAKPLFTRCDERNLPLRTCLTPPHQAIGHLSVSLGCLLRSLWLFKPHSAKISPTANAFLHLPSSGGTIPLIRINNCFRQLNEINCRLADPGNQQLVTNR